MFVRRLIIKTRTVSTRVTLQVSRALVASVRTSVCRAFLTFQHHLTPRRGRVTQLRIARVEDSVSVLTRMYLLKDVPQGSSIIRRGGNTRRTTAVRPFKKDTDPGVESTRRTVHHNCGTNNVLLRNNAPFLLERKSKFKSVSLATIKVDRLVGNAFYPLPLRTISYDGVESNLQYLTKL